MCNKIRKLGNNLSFTIFIGTFQLLKLVKIRLYYYSNEVYLISQNKKTSNGLY
jgi:hypothetical protein